MTQNMEDDRNTLQVGESCVNPLPDEASSTKWEPEKKAPLCGSFFSDRPLAGAAPQSVPASRHGQKYSTLLVQQAQIACTGVASRSSVAHVQRGISLVSIARYAASSCSAL